MIIAQLAILVLEKVLGIDNAVGIGCQPLTALMEEKLKNPPICTGFISMSGDLQYSLISDEVHLSQPMTYFKNGTVKCILGHAESMVSVQAKEVLDHHQKNGKIVFIFVDECQMNLCYHWGEDFRPHMKNVPGQLR